GTRIAPRINRQIDSSGSRIKIAGSKAARGRRPTARREGGARAARAPPVLAHRQPARALALPRPAPAPGKPGTPRRGHRRQMPAPAVRPEAQGPEPGPGLRRPSGVRPRRAGPRRQVDLRPVGAPSTLREVGVALAPRVRAVPLAGHLAEEQGAGAEEEEDDDEEEILQTPGIRAATRFQTSSSSSNPHEKSIILGGHPDHKLRRKRLRWVQATLPSAT